MLSTIVLRGCIGRWSLAYRSLDWIVCVHLTLVLQEAVIFASGRIGMFASNGGTEGNTLRYLGHLNNKHPLRLVKYTFARTYTSKRR
jgi:hypothetical protein